MILNSWMMLIPSLNEFYRSSDTFGDHPSENDTVQRQGFYEDHLYTQRKELDQRAYLEPPRFLTIRGDDTRPPIDMNCNRVEKFEIVYKFLVYQFMIDGIKGIGKVEFDRV